MKYRHFCALLICQGQRLFWQMGFISSFEWTIAQRAEGLEEELPATPVIFRIQSTVLFPNHAENSRDPPWVKLISVNHIHSYLYD